MKGSIVIVGLNWVIIDQIKGDVSTVTFLITEMIFH